MENKSILIDGCNLIITHSYVEIDVNDYIHDYRDKDKFIIYCQECEKHNANWSCPPFGFNIEGYISGYEKARIIGSKILLDKELIKQCQSNKMCTQILSRIIETVRLDLDKDLFEAENQYFKAKAFFAGPCYKCHPSKCKRIKGEPCIAPYQLRPSLESLGFDICKTSSELLDIEMKWCIGDILPEYFTLVSGLFFKDKIKVKL